MKHNPKSEIRSAKHKTPALEEFFALERTLFVVCDFNGYFKWLNPAWSKVLGYSLDELCSKPFFEFLHPDDRDSTLLEMDKLAKGEEVLTFENRYIAKDGTERWLLWSGLTPAKGELVYGLARDITQRKSHESELIDISIALENAVEGVAKVDSYGRFTAVNSAFAENLGYKSEELLGAHWHIGVHPDDVPNLQVAYHKMLAEGKSEIETRGIKRDGNLSHSRIVLVKARDPNKQYVGHYCFMKDITAHKQAEASLEKTESRLANLLRHVPGVLYQFLVQSDGRAKFAYVSESSRHILGYEPFEFQNDVSLATRCVHPDDRKILQQAMQNPGGELAPFRFELRCLTKSSDIKWVMLSSAPEKLDNGDVLWNGLLTDITELKTAEAKIKQLNEDLAQRISVLAAVNQELEIITHKLEVAYDQALEASKLKSEFVANISHEVRTPISAVIGMVELLLDSNLSPEQRQFAKIVGDSAQSLLTIINDILDFSKMEAGRIELESIDFNINGIVKGCVDWLESVAKDKKIRFETVVDPNVPRLVKGDPLRVRQVLLNLASNAIKFTDVGTVKLSTQLINNSLDGDEQSVTVRFDIEDTGIGLSEAAKNRLFQPFSQADGSTTRKYGGTGLGLSISKRLVELMGGEIGVDSQENKGSRFYFTVPFILSAASGEENQSESDLGGSRLHDLPVQQISHVSLQELSGKLSSSSSRKVEPGSRGLALLAEDNSILKDLACRQLVKLGFSVKSVNNGKEAIEHLGKDDYSLIFMDCQMPVMDGFEATKAIRNKEKQTGKHVLIVALTASAMPADRERCLKCGMDDYLSKPINLQQLAQLVDKWLPVNSDFKDNSSTQFASKIDNMKDADNQNAEKMTEANADGTIDLENLKQIYGQESLEEIFTMFLDEAKGLVTKIDEGVKKHDKTQVATAAHQLKGVAAAVSAMKLNKTSSELEGAAAAEIWQQATLLTEGLIREHNLLKKFIEDYLREQFSCQK